MNGAVKGIIALSLCSAGAEYVSVSTIFRDLVWLHNICQEFHVLKKHATLVTQKNVDSMG